MKNARIVLIALCAAVVSAAFANSPDRPQSGAQLYLDVLGRSGVTTVASAVPGGTGSSRVVFVDEDLRFASYLAITPPGSRTADAMQKWWERLRITVADQHGTVRTIASPDLQLLEARVDGKVVLGKGSNYAAVWDHQANVVRFTIAPLPPGDYVARAEFLDTPRHSLVSGPAFFVIRRGDENDSIVRLYLRKQADETSNYDEYKRVMLKLYGLEPDNAWIIESIAEHSLNIAPPTETLSWFRKAREMRQAAGERYVRERGTRLTNEERRSMDEQLASVSLFEKVYPEYVAHQQDRRLVIIGGGRARQYAWFTKDGRMIGVIDLHDPSIVRPITTHEQR